MNILLSNTDKKKKNQNHLHTGVAGTQLCDLDNNISWS